MNAEVDQIYVDLIETVMELGDRPQGRNGTTTRIICQVAEFERPPVVSIRSTAWKNALREWEWFMSGSNNIKDLHPDVIPWWTNWVDGGGFHHYGYGEQFRRCDVVYDSDGDTTTFDQIEYLLEQLKSNPSGRRAVISTWHAPDMAQKDCRLPNCHGSLIQCFVREGTHLDLFMYQRSCDLIVGVPHNWIQYWAFLQWLAHRCALKVGSFIWMGGDIHIYEEHLPLAARMVTEWNSKRIDEWQYGKNPLELTYKPSSHEFKADDFSLKNYQSIIKEKAELVV